LGEKDPKVVSGTALEIFFNITKSWGLKAQEKRILLGDPASCTPCNEADGTDEQEDFRVLWPTAPAPLSSGVHHFPSPASF
jgi:hypothetical protein